MLDHARGVGTRSPGLAAPGHRATRFTGSDLSSASVARAAREAAHRSLTPARRRRRHAGPCPSPTPPDNAVVRADNALPHLLTARDVDAALAETRGVPRPGGLPLLSTRPYGEPLRARPDVERDVLGAAGGGDGRVTCGWAGFADPLRHARADTGSTSRYSSPGARPRHDGRPPRDSGRGKRWTG
ncbi:hypothetical protein ACWGIU_14660 [Streptomyces sp. NPDC054840]